MYDIRRFIDPLVLGIKVRDSIRSGNPSYIQDYMIDILKNSVNQTRDGQGNAARTPSSPNVQKQIQDTVTQSLSQIQGVPGMGDASYLQKYVLNLLNQTLGQILGQTLDTPAAASKLGRNSRQAAPHSKENAEVFETHDYVFVRVPVPEQVDERHIDTQIGPSRVVIKWAPGGKEHVIQLPADVKNGGASASVKEHVLEIKIPKEQRPNLKKVQIQRG